MRRHGSRRESKKSQSSFLSKLKNASKDKDKPNVVKIFEHLFIKKIKEIEYLEMQYNFDIEKTNEESLIEELQKPVSTNLQNFPLFNSNSDYIKTYKKEISSTPSPTDKAQISTKNVINEGRFEKESKSKVILPSNVRNTRDTAKIAYLLKKLEGFGKFMKYNNITDDELKTASGSIKYEFLSKGEYVFYEGEPSKRFYGIIKGKVSLRLHKPKNKATNSLMPDSLKTKSSNNDHGGNFLRSNSSLNNDRIHVFITNKSKEGSIFNFTPNVHKSSYRELNKTTNLALHRKHLKKDYEEVEKVQIGNGMCFGEWGLVYNIPRTASAITVEDTHLFYLDKDNFDSSFSKCIARADIFKKNFILKKIPFIKSIGRIEDYLKRIIPSFFDYKQIVYTTFDQIECIYIVYHGEFVLCQLKKDNITCRDDVVIHKDKMITVCKMAQGAICGLEIAESSQCYKYNLISNSDNACLFKITIDTIKENNAAIKQHLQKIYHEHESYIQDYIGKFKNVKNRMKFMNNKNINKESFFIENEKAMTEKVMHETTINNFKQKYNTRREKNMFKTNSMICVQPENNDNNLQNSNINSSFNIHNHNHKLNSQHIEKILADNSKKLLKNFSLDAIINLNSMQSTLKSKSSIKDSNTNSNLNSANNTPRTSVFVRKKTMKKLNTREAIKIEENGFENLYLNKKKVKLNSKLMQHLDRSLMNWNNSQTNEKNYNSGKFTLPLISSLNDK